MKIPVHYILYLISLIPINVMVGIWHSCDLKPGSDVVLEACTFMTFVYDVVGVSLLISCLVGDRMEQITRWLVNKIFQ